jgi:hypothetical protein
LLLLEEGEVEGGIMGTTMEITMVVGINNQIHHR